MLWTLLLTLDYVEGAAWFKESVLLPIRTCGLVPAGHLQPFGYHKQPCQAMDTIPNTITVEEFYQRYIEPDGHRPGIFRGLQADSEAVQKWTDSYIKEKFGHYKVLTEVKHEHRQKYGKSLNTLSGFLEDYNTTNQYIVTVLPDGMRRDVLMPQLLQCGTFSDNILELNYWMASGNTASQVHYDADHNIHCLIAGRKSFIMIHPDQHHKMKMERLKNTGSDYSPNINQNKVNMEELESVADVDYVWDVLYPGDCIFIPSKYLHQVRSYGRSISVTILWDPTTELEVESLRGCKISNTSSIADHNVIWNHEADDIFFDVGYATPYVMRRELLDIWDEWESLLRSSEANVKVNSGWSYDQFISMMFETKKWELAQCSYTSLWVAVIGYGLDRNKDLQISRSELASSSDGMMKAVSHFVDEPNLPDKEYDFCRKRFYYLPPEALTAQDLSDLKTVGTVKKWLQLKGYSPSYHLSEVFRDFLTRIRDVMAGGGDEEESLNLLPMEYGPNYRNKKEGED